MIKKSNLGSPMNFSVVFNTAPEELPPNIELAFATPEEAEITLAELKLLLRLQ